jgi:hypothetical protein
MKKKFLIIFSALTLVLALPSCKKYLDINVNPNAATTLDPKLLFSYAVTSYVNLRTSGDLQFPTALAGQTMSDGFANPTGWSGGGIGEQQYTIDPLIYGNPWRAYYTSVGNNLKQAIKIAESANPRNNNAAAQCKVMLALVYYELATLYGDVPYAEAFREDVQYPKFDTQETVLNGVIAILDEAIAQFDDTATGNVTKISDYDLFYKGKLSQWVKVAKSLKLRTLMTMVDKDATKAAAIGAMMTAGGMVSSADDNFFVPFQNIQGKWNPKYDIANRYNANLNFFFASKYVTDYLDPMNDPRLPKFFDKPAAATNYVGVEPGATGFDNINPRISVGLHRADQPETIFNYQEQLFYEAEIYARGLGVPQNTATANTLLKAAVNASCKFYGVATATADAFSAGLPTYVAPTGTNSVLYNIHYQHWVDKFDRGLDALTQFRRSGDEGSEVPALTIPIGAPPNGLFRRYEYPISNEINQNPNAPKVTIKYYEKTWFDK